MKRKALLLLGSPRERGTSMLLGKGILEGLAARGWETETLRLAGLLEAQGGRARLIGEFTGADLCILSAPVYVDSPPAPVMRALEFLAGEPGGGPGQGGRRFAAIFNCGFPEVEHTDICLDVCRLFARDAGLHWAGGLGVGGGGAVGDTLDARGKLTLNLRRALDMAVQALALDADIPDEARALAAKPILSRRLYLLFAEYGWFRLAAKHKTLFKLGERPFKT